MSETEGRPARTAGETLTTARTETIAGSRPAVGAGTAASSEKTNSAPLPASEISARSVAPARSSKSATPRNATARNRFQYTLRAR